MSVFFFIFFYDIIYLSHSFIFLSLSKMCNSYGVSINYHFCLYFQVPNGVGSVLGTMQLILYFIYRKNKGETKKATTQEESMEMGTAKTPSSSKEATQSN